MAGTLTPTPYQTVLDGDGVAVSGAKITTTDTGTGVAAATYTNAALTSANTNPIVADSAGRYVAYLPAGANFTFAITTSAGAAIETQTNIQAVPGSSVNLDIEGTVGQAVTAGQVLYLSSAAESPALTAGKWYLTDSDAAATSTTPQSIGVAVSAIAINTAGTIRLAGEVDSAGSVVVGTTYYIGATPGAIVSSAPAFSRQVGVGLTTSSLLLAATTAVASLLPNPIAQDLLFVDATYDIGKSGASRPRDLFASRNAVVGGNLTVTEDIVVSGAGPHVIGGSTLGRTRLLLDGSFTSDGSGNTMEALRSQGVITGASGDTAHLAGAWFANSITTQAVSETITTVAQVIIDDPSITVGSGATITNSASLYIKAAATEATNDYALWVDSGATRLDGTLGVSGISTFTADLVATGASMSFQDNEGVALGTGSDATIQYNGTNVSLDTQAVGSGLLIVTGSAAISGVEIDNTAADGDPTLAFTLSGTSLFTMGVDDGDSDKFKIGTTAIGTNTALTIDGSQNIGIGTAAPGAKLVVAGATAATGILRVESTTDHAINTGGSIAFIGRNTDGSTATSTWGVIRGYDESAASGNGDGYMAFDVGKDGGAPQERMRISSAGTVTIGGDVSLAATKKLYLDGGSNTYIRESAADVIQFVTGAADGVWVGAGGLYIGAYNGDNHLTDASAGGGSATLYIGNQSITTSSDRRLKANIVDSSLNAVEALNRLRVTDYNWNDPSDTSFNNRNARGLWTGLIAQEVVEHLPFAVNAPRDEEKVIDHGSDSTWSIESIALCGVLIKAVQELSARIEGLES